MRFNYKISFQIAYFYLKSHNIFQSNRIANSIKIGNLISHRTQNSIHWKLASNMKFHFRLRYRFRSPEIISLYLTKNSVHSKFSFQIADFKLYRNKVVNCVKDNWFLFRKYAFHYTKDLLQYGKKKSLQIWTITSDFPWI